MDKKNQNVCPSHEVINCRESSEIVDHSSGDVAYLRLTAHTEVRPNSSALCLQAPAILESEFQAIHDAIIKVPRVQNVEFMAPESTHIAVETKPRIVQIGDGVFATDTIAPPATFSVRESMLYCFDTLTSKLPLAFLIVALLQQQNLAFQNIITITLLLQDMSDFTLVNPIYSTYFPLALPPSRVTISTTISEKVRLSAIISSRPRTGLHVQSRSYWAPANIGPYSQSISVLPWPNSTQL
jgi:diphthine-ammonia ligase